MSALPDPIASAVHTVTAELPTEVPVDDKLDAVFGIVGQADFEDHEDAITALLERMS